MVSAEFAPAIDDTRRRILATALELIAAQGFASTSTREISQRLGFTKAALYYHFRTKDDLLAALLEPILDDLRALVAPQSAADDAHTLLASYVDVVARHEDSIRVLSQDPSVRLSECALAARPLYARLMERLAPKDEPSNAATARVRAALAAIQGVFVFAPPEEDRAVLRSIALSSARRVLRLAE